MMPTLDERVSVLETRVDELAGQTRLNTREVKSALAAHHHNTALLNALRVTQADHTGVLAEHTRVLADHTRTLAEHTQILGKLMVGMHGLELMIKQLLDRDGPASH